MRAFSFLVFVLLFSAVSLSAKSVQRFPDGTPVSKWFLKSEKLNPDKLGKKFVITDYGAVKDSTIIQTKVIQQVIDEAARQGGGVVVIPKGVFLSGALFFKPKTKLYVSEGAVLKGSDNIADFPVMPSRMEGQNLDYFPALVNAYGVNGFSISGKGTINGNGLNYWKAFWQRRAENKNCTNLEVSRPRLVFIQHSNDVQLQDVKLINSGFWTTHFYKCNNVKMLGLYIYSPFKPVKAPSTDAIDIDVCTNFLVKGCYLSVNDDAIALKGGKGPTADKDENNGPNRNIIIEDCEFGFCHSCLTNGSESIHNRNVIMRNCSITNAQRLLWLKLREDTPQHYEYILVENIKGQAKSLLTARRWSQFFDLKGHTEIPKSQSNNITLRNIDFECETFFDVVSSKNNTLTDFTLENMNVKATKGDVDKTQVQNLVLKNVIVNGVGVQ